MLTDGRSPGNSRRPGIGWSIAALVMTVIAIRLLREGVGPGAGIALVSSGDSDQQGGQSIFYSCCWLAGALAFFRLGRGSGHWTSSALTSGVTLTLAGIMAAFTTHTSYAKSSVSSYTQAHGVVESVTAPSSGGTYDSPDDSRTSFTVSLNKPVKGHSSTAVYTSGFVTFPNDGSSFVIRVDPQDAGYAELPGEPYQTVGETESAAAFAAVALAFGITGLVQSGRARPRWRAWRDRPSESPAT